MNGKESSLEIYPQLYNQLIFDKRCKNKQLSKNNLLIKHVEKIGQICAKKKKKETRPPPYTIHKNKLKTD